jgi:hypothetical protein
MRLTTTATLGIAAVAVIGGCGVGNGQGDEKDAVRGSLSDLQELSRAGDAQTICRESFAPQLTRTIVAKSKSHSCVTVVRRELATPNETINVKGVQITGATNAMATVTEQTGKSSTLSLVKQGGKWRVRSITPPLTNQR